VAHPSSPSTMTPSGNCPPNFAPSPNNQYCVSVPHAANGGVTVPTGLALSLKSTTVVSSLPRVVGGVSSVLGIPGVLGGVVDLFCRYFPRECNILSPGARFPTEDPRTPAPGGGQGIPGPVSTSDAGRARFEEGRPAAPAGYHWNKGTYWTNAGVVFAGTRIVKNRRMNPLNPRALARAVRRGDSFVRFASALGMQKPKTGLKKKRCRR